MRRFGPLPTFAQQTDTSAPGIAQQRDLLGNARAIGEFGEFSQKQEEAYSEKDAAALAALFTEDALLVAPDGMFSGRQAIEKRYEEMFQRSPFTSFGDPRHIC